MDSAAAKGKGVVIFGGGTATNSLVDIFNDLRESRACTLSYVIPISDNGGSSSELIRVFGGPGKTSSGPSPLTLAKVVLF